MVQLRGDLTKKMEDGAGKVRFRRWKNMTIGARISLVILIAIIVVAALADFNNFIDTSHMKIPPFK